MPQKHIIYTYIQIFIVVLRVWMIFSSSSFLLSLTLYFSTYIHFFYFFSFFHNLSYSSGFSLSDKKGIFLNIFHFHFEKLIFIFFFWLDAVVGSTKITFHILLVFCTRDWIYCLLLRTWQSMSFSSHQFFCLVWVFH